MRTLAVFLMAALFFSCSTIPQVQPTQQEILIKIQGVDTVQVVEQQASKEASRTMSVENPYGELSMMTFLIGEEAYSMIVSGISVGDVTRFWKDIHIIESMGIKTIQLFVNSGGGDAFTGLALADEIKRAQGRGTKVVAHASGIIASATVPVFAVCDLRIAAPGTIFMVHETSIWKWAGQESSSDLDSQREMIELLRCRYLDTLTDHSNLTKEEWREMEKKTSWFGSDDAKKYGIVDLIE